MEQEAESWQGKGEEKPAFICCAIHTHKEIHKDQLLTRDCIGADLISVIGKELSPTLALSPSLHQQRDGFGRMG